MAFRDGGGRHSLSVSHCLFSSRGRRLPVPRLESGECCSRKQLPTLWCEVLRVHRDSPHYQTQ